MATPRMDITSFVGKLLEQDASTRFVKAFGCSPRR
jgi:hypothetical protein